MEQRQQLVAGRSRLGLAALPTELCRELALRNDPKLEGRDRVALALYVGIHDARLCAAVHRELSKCDLVARKGRQKLEKGGGGVPPNPARASTEHGACATRLI